MGAMQRRKGAAGEREGAAQLREIGLENADRAARNGVDGGEDITLAAIPGVRVECKRVERLNVEQALAQCEKDAGKLIACLLHRRNRSDWIISVRAKQLEPFCVALLRALGHSLDYDINYECGGLE